MQALVARANRDAKSRALVGNTFRRFAVAPVFTIATPQQMPTLSLTTSHTPSAKRNQSISYPRTYIDPQPTPTMTTFEPSLSASMRASPHDAPSMADQLPTINFGFDDLRSRMNQFTARFDDFIEKGRRRVLEERNQFRMNVAEVQGTTCTAFSAPRMLTTE